MPRITSPSYRRNAGMPLPIKIITFFLAILLIISGIVFIVYSETTQYRVALNNGVTAIALNTRDSYLKAKSTSDALNTAQAYINATATAQADAVGNATAGVDNATATASALDDLYTQSTRGDPIFDDALTDNTGPGYWDQGNSNANTGCAFENGSYVVREAGQNKFQPCIARATSFSNFAYQVYLTIVNGNLGQAGLIFRASANNTSYYFFHIDTNGSYALDLYGQSNQVSNLLQGVSSTISVGLGQSNQIAVIANSGTLYFYASRHYLASVTDSTLSAGKVGLGVVDRSTPVEVQFTNAQVWQLAS